MRPLLWILAGVLVAAVVAALVIGVAFATYGRGGLFGDLRAADWAVFALVLTVPTALAGALVLGLMRSVLRLNVLTIPTAGAIAGGGAALLGGDLRVALLCAGLGAVSCLVAYPLLIRANRAEDPSRGPLDEES